MTEIIDIVAREILDSRGNPTVEVDVTLEDGSFGRAAVPSGASTGTREAVELRDGDKSRFGGKGVLKAVESVNGEIFDAISGFDAEDQVHIDEAMIELDGTHNKARLGANAILGVSLAVAKAAADARGLPLYRYVGGAQARVLPTPMMNIINGGAHADNPDRFPGIHDHPARRGLDRGSRALGRGSVPWPEIGAEKGRPEHQCRRRRRLRARTCRRPKRRSISSSRRSRRRASSRARTSPSASTPPPANFSRTAPIITKARARSARSRNRPNIWHKLAAAYPIVSIEDGNAEQDWDGWKITTDLIGKKVQIVGDDIFVTNVNILSEGIKKGVANSILIKVNQIGTLTETLAAVDMAQRAGYTAVMSHRSGETEDATIADLAVATNCGQIKTGSLARSDRLAKYNQLIRIEEELGKQAIYAGRAAFKALD